MAPDILEITFPTLSKKCTLFFGERLIDEPSLENVEASSTAIVSDDVVARLYGSRLQKSLSRRGKTTLVTMSHGERNKNLRSVSLIAKKLSDAGLDRKSTIVALGGGVVGDLAGFVASIFKRGISYYQFPTTLLAQVDSGIGGKCAIDTQWGKNQLGTFHQPQGVFVDTSLLDSLPQKEVINGLGEIVKSSIIADRGMFDKISESGDDYFSLQKLKTLVRPTCQIKAKVVESDEHETGLRKILNYGHTLGHAFEASSGYRLSHGKGVILGMICEGWIANSLGIFEESDYFRQKELLSRIKSHYKISSALDGRNVLSFAMLDKKNTSGTIEMSLPEKIGRMHSGNGSYSVSVSKELLLESLRLLR
jgi:3-dehydroquinate synthase